MAIDYSDVCSKASGLLVRRGFDKLGPINDLGSLLLPASNSDAGAQLAAEQIAHLVEGWRYVSSAISAYLNNSKDGAIHFGYYAELRASMSLLAWSGIRVRQGDYWYLNVHGHKCDMGREKTHPAVRGLWGGWINRADAKGLFLRRVRLTASVDLGHVIDAVAFVDPSQQLGGWGKDLIRLGADHESRNKSSYQADIVGRSLSRLSKKEFDFVAKLWDLFTPGRVGAKFDCALAQHIVGPLLISASDAAEGGRDTASNRLEKIVSKVAEMTGEKPAVISSILVGEDEGPCSVFDFASSEDAGAENVLSRAFCLLRMAMLALDSNLREAGKPAASSWIKNWLNHAGIWSEDLECEPGDIATDYELALGEFVTEKPSGLLWNVSSLESVMRITRPDACLAWNLSL